MKPEVRELQALFPGSDLATLSNVFAASGEDVAAAKQVQLAKNAPVGGRRFVPCPSHLPAGSRNCGSLPSCASCDKGHDRPHDLSLGAACLVWLLSPVAAAGRRCWRRVACRRRAARRQARRRRSRAPPARACSGSRPRPSCASPSCPRRSCPRAAPCAGAIWRTTAFTRCTRPCFALPFWHCYESHLSCRGQRG